MAYSYRNFESLYLDNRLRYQGESKNDFNGIVSSLCSEWVLMDFAWKFQVSFVILQWSIYSNVNLFNIHVNYVKKEKKNKTESSWPRKQVLKKEK